MTRFDGPAGCRAASIMKAGVLLGAAFAVSSCSTLSEWRNPTVELPIRHPPGLGVMVATVSFDRDLGRCAREVVEDLRAELTRSSVESRPGYLSVPSVDDGLAGAEGEGAKPPRIGRRVEVDITEFTCGFDRERSSSTQERTRTTTEEVDGEEVEVTEKYTETVYRSTASLNAGLSIEFEDLGTGGSLGRRQLSYRPEASSTSTSWYPDYPSESGLLREMANKASDELFKTLSPWTESKSVLFYDTDECDLGVAYSQLELGDAGKALEFSLSNLARCANNPDMDDEFRAAAYYNVAVLHLMQEDHAAAIEVLDEAMLLDADNTAITALRSDAERVRELQTEIERIEREGAALDP